MRYKNMKYENIGLTRFHIYFICLETNAKELYNLSTNSPHCSEFLKADTSFFYYLERFCE